MTATPAAPAYGARRRARRRARDHLLRRHASRTSSGAATRGHARHPPARAGIGGGSQLRYDVLTGEWVAIAGAPQDPHLPAARRTSARSARPAAARADRDPRHDYDVVVFENRFPSLRMPADGRRRGLVDAEPLWPVRPGARALRGGRASPPTTTRRSPR